MDQIAKVTGIRFNVELVGIAATVLASLKQVQTGADMSTAACSAAGDKDVQERMLSQKPRLRELYALQILQEFRSRRNSQLERMRLLMMLQVQLVKHSTEHF